MSHCGPFELHEILGRGGFGGVWRAVHLPTGTHVALKRLHGVPDARHRRLLGHEVRAAAALGHPGVITLYDAAIEDDEPWIAMELGSATLGDTPLEGWTELRSLLLQVLDALAHAHARHVVHRDIKPSNVVRVGDHWKLVDFGIARALGQDLDAATSSGTPRYMPPEQILGDAREQGPETDLYALACVAWELVTGSAPFLDPLAHLAEPPPPLAPRLDVPDGLERWLGRLLKKAPSTRYRSAAEAAWALCRLEGGGAGRAVAAPVALTMTLAELDVTHEPLVPTPGVRPDSPPLPVRWDEGVGEQKTAHLPRAGLGLYGLRALPVVGRRDEREQLWQALRESREEPRAVLLSGAAGVGKSRLARWVCERAAECGAIVWQATHADPPDPLDGVRGLVLRAVRGVGLDAAGIRQRIAATVPASTEHDPDWLDALTAIAAPGERPFRFSGPRHRHLAVVRLVAALGAPAVLWIDDAQYGHDAIGVARLLVGERVPVLIVVTLRDDLPGPSLDDLDPVRIAVGPLDEVACRDLTRDLLDLDGPIVSRIADRSGGNPLFVTGLVGDWVARQVLVPEDHGFRPRPDAALELPESLAAVWRSRVEGLLDEEALQSVERAAVLGHAIDRDEWERAAGTPPDISALLRERLLVERDGLHFAHGMLREALIARAAEAGRSADHHLACARALDPELQPARVGRHLLAAGAAVEAVPLLLEGAWREDLAMREDVALSLHEDLERALRALPESDPARGRAGVRKASLVGGLRREEGNRIAYAVLADAQKHDWQQIRVAAGCYLATRLLLTARDAEGRALLDEAEQVAEALGDPKEQERVAMLRALTLITDRRYDDAETSMRVALGSEDGLIRATTIHLQARSRLVQGLPEEARGLLEEAATVARAAGCMNMVGRALGDLGVVDQMLGRFDEAVTSYRRAVHALGGESHPDVVAPLNNLACIHTLRGDLAEARRCCALALPRSIHGSVAARIYILVVAWACDLDRHALPEAERLMDEAAAYDDDYLKLAEGAAERARAAGDEVRLAGALAFAARMQARFGA